MGALIKELTPRPRIESRKTRKPETVFVYMRLPDTGPAPVTISLEGTKFLSKALPENAMTETKKDAGATPFGIDFGVARDNGVSAPFDSKKTSTCTQVIQSIDPKTHTISDDSKMALDD